MTYDERIQEAVSGYRAACAALSSQLAATQADYQALEADRDRLREALRMVASGSRGRYYAKQALADSEAGTKC